MTIREALLSMNYRETKPGVWAKPIGFSLFVFRESDQRWSNWYMAADESGPQVYEWHDMSEHVGTDFLNLGLKQWEAYTEISKGISRGGPPPQFQLSALDI